MLEKERVRFAPAPSGSLHIGNCRTALFNWLIAKKSEGSFILRIDDTSHKATPEIVTSILDDLAWLGIIPDEGPYLQSQRLHRYREVVKILLEEGKAYPCFCKEKPKGRCFKCSSKGVREIVDGVPIRLKTGYKRKIFNDLVFGEVSLKTEQDPIIWRSNGLPTYYLTSAVDDIDYGITLVMRGEDLLSSTPYQIFIMECFGKNLPKFVHLPLIFLPDGKKISKREGGYTLKELKEKGVLKEAVINVMALSGWSPPVAKDRFSTKELIELFSIDRISKAQSSFDWQKLFAFHKDHLKEIPDEILKERLLPYIKEFELEDDKLDLIVSVIKKEGWLFSEVKEHLSFLKPVESNIEISNEEREILLLWREKLSRVEGELYSSFKEIAEDIGRIKGKSRGEVIRLIRRVITHKEHGLGMDIVFKLLPLKEVINRLEKSLLFK